MPTEFYFLSVTIRIDEFKQYTYSKSDFVLKRNALNFKRVQRVRTKKIYDKIIKSFRNNGIIDCIIN